MRTRPKTKSKKNKDQDCKQEWEEKHNFFTLFLALIKKQNTRTNNKNIEINSNDFIHLSIALN